MNAGLTIIFMLFMLNIVLMFQLLYCNRFYKDEIKISINNTLSRSQKLQRKSKLLSSNVTRSEYVSDMSQMAFSNIDFTVGRWDNQRLYKLFDFAIVGKLFKKAEDKSYVCLATQSSIERLQSIVQVANNWNGPISIAVFIAGTEEFKILQYYVSYLRVCFLSIRGYVAFHIAVPSDMVPQPGLNELNITYKGFSCQYPENILYRLLKYRGKYTIQWRLKNTYPQNHMRNLARKGCQSMYVFLTDIDIIPSRNMAEELNGFLKKTECNSQCAFVIPTYEIDIQAMFPSSKKELLFLVKKGLARPFHEKIFIYNQFATNFSRWQANKLSEKNVHISHRVTSFEFLYEPFYVALDIMPIYDERFLGYGFTRNSQVYEMYISGYEFYVLSPIFTCHWGLQQKKTRPVWREQQNNINSKKFERFRNEILIRYKKYSFNSEKI